MSAIAFNELVSGPVATPIQGVTLRLADPDDRKFASKMTRLAGAGRQTQRFNAPTFQDGVRAALTASDPPQEFRVAIARANNEAITTKRNEVLASFAAASFLLIAEDDGVPVAGVLMSPPASAVNSLLARGAVGSAQLQACMNTTSKVIALSVEAQYRSSGIGKMLLGAAIRLVGSLGVLVIMADCKPAMVPFNARFGLNPVSTNVAGRPGLNLWPLVGDWIRGAAPNPDSGPFIKPASGWVLCARVRAGADRRLNMMRALHPEL